jgi:hypothetical protein
MTSRRDDDDDDDDVSRGMATSRRERDDDDASSSSSFAAAGAADARTRTAAREAFAVARPRAGATAGRDAVGARIVARRSERKSARRRRPSLVEVASSLCSSEIANLGLRASRRSSRGARSRAMDRDRDRARNRSGFGGGYPPRQVRPPPRPRRDASPTVDRSSRSIE